MTLDVPTLMIAGAFAAAMCGALLIVAWWHSRETPACLWWAISFFMQAPGIVLLALGEATDRQAARLSGLALLALAPALTLLAARSLRGRRTNPVLLLAGILLWLACNAVPAFRASDIVAASVYAAMVAAYYFLTARELGRKPDEPLRVRIPLIALVVVHGTVLLVGIPMGALSDLPPGTPPQLGSWFGIIHFEFILYAIGTALFLLAMMKERSVQEHRHEANTDALTGLPNRRGFLNWGERLKERCRRDGTPLAVVAFDLDRFKAVNDTFGHAIGDHALRLFAATARDLLRPGDTLGRVGGEEFSAILPGAGLQAGCAMAERIRQGFSEAGLTIDGRVVNATVSAGVTAVNDASVPLAVLFEQADVALYRAKLNGRNRVECSEAATETYPRLVRVA